MIGYQLPGRKRSRKWYACKRCRIGDTTEDSHAPRVWEKVQHTAHWLELMLLHIQLDCNRLARSAPQRKSLQMPCAPHGPCSQCSAQRQRQTSLHPVEITTCVTLPRSARHAHSTQTSDRQTCSSRLCKYSIIRPVHDCQSSHRTPVMPLWLGISFSTGFVTRTLFGMTKTL